MNAVCFMVCICSDFLRLLVSIRCLGCLPLLILFSLYRPVVCYLLVSFGSQLLVSSVLAQQRGTASCRKIKAKQAKTKCCWLILLLIS